jgi:hypothetical protein
MIVGNTDAAITFLELWERNGPWLLTAIEPDSGKIQTRPFSDVNSARRWIERYQGKRNIYFSPNRVRAGLTSKAKKTDVTDLLTLHTDLDPRKDPDVDLALEQAAILDRLKGHNPPPTTIIFSGGGYQGFWRLAQPVPVNGNIAALEAYNRGLEQALGGDHCHNIDRIMRLPGTINLPDARKRAAGRIEVLAEVIYFDRDRLYQLTDFIPLDDEEPELGEPDDLQRVLDRLPKWIVDRLKVTTAPDRSKALFSVIATLLKRGLADDTIERIIRAFPNGIGSKYVGRGDLAAEIGRIRSRTAAGRNLRNNASEDDLEVGEDELGAERRRIEKAAKAVIENFNSRYAVVNEAGKVWVFEWRLDPVLGRDVLDRISHGDFRKLYENKRIDVLVGNLIKSKSVADLWLTDPNRQQYTAGVTFDPTDSAPPDYMNLWRGFGAKPTPGDWSLLRDHIFHVVCSGDLELQEYVLSWMARAIQYPNLPGEVALILRGGEGIGKGILGRWFCRAFGQHGIQIYHPTQLTGRFNEHLRDCIALFADEAFFAGDRAHEGVLRGLITEPLLPIEGKFLRVVVVPNLLHIIMASNKDWVVPASIDARRYFVLDVSDHRVGQLQYFAAIEQQMRNGGLAAMLHDLMTRNIAGFEVRNIPQTEGLKKQKTLSLDTLEQWWLDVLSREFIWKSRAGADYFQHWHTFYTTELLFRSYMQWCKENYISSYHCKSRSGLGNFLTKLYQSSRPQGKFPIYELESFDRYSDDVRVHDLDEISIAWQDHPRGYIVGEIHEARIRFTQLYDVNIEWGLQP